MSGEYSQVNSVMHLTLMSNPSELCHNIVGQTNRDINLNTWTCLCFLTKLTLNYHRDNASTLHTRVITK